MTRSNVINGGDAIIQRILRMFSVHVAFASAVVLLICFVVWQVRTGASWRIDPRKLVIKFIESMFFAVILFLFLGWLSIHLPAPGAVVCAGTDGRDPLDSPLMALVLYCGAGIYEELVFRVLLLGLLILVFTKLLHWEKAPAAAAAVVAGAILFSLFHYVGGAEGFHINSFLQRAFAGVYFAAIYVTRSFGVAAASHALYDILVGIQCELG